MATGSRKIRFVMLGGFLGAGKTTSIVRLAEHYRRLGQSVGIVTNDQASDLVDTSSLRAQGFDVGEVAGACFCCHFNQLIQTVQQLDDSCSPDVILAEPVGSCTDLVATVIQPLKQLYNSRFSIAPYAVILKPSQGRKILKNQPGSGFSPKAAYIFEKQLEEADLILINRTDELSPAELRELTDLLEAQYPHIPRLAISAKTGAGFEAYFEFLSQEGDFGRKLLDVDYDVYAEGEAELGWLNSAQTLRSNTPVSLDAILLGLVEQLRRRLDGAGYEAAHLKAIGLSDGVYGVANLVSTGVPVEVSLQSRADVTECHLVINARAACDPEILTDFVQQALAHVGSQFGLTIDSAHVQSFRPGRPVPTHRLQPAPLM